MLVGNPTGKKVRFWPCASKRPGPAFRRFGARKLVPVGASTSSSSPAGGFGVRVTVFCPGEVSKNTNACVFGLCFR